MTQKLVCQIAQAIVDKKGFNVVALDLREVGTMADFCIVAEGNVDRHVKAIAEVVEEVMEKEGDSLVRVEGLSNPEWVVVDSWEISVHIFTPQLRQKYRIESLWEEAKIIELDLDFSPISKVESKI